MTIIEGNKLIAEFMGWEKSPYPNTPDKLYRDDDKNEKQLSIHVSQLLYHSSWDWLMPVVDKIEQVSINHYTGFTVDIRRKHCCIYCHQKGRMDGIIYQTEWNKERETKILTVWEACVQFIQWYNENKIK